MLIPTAWLIMADAALHSDHLSEAERCEMAMALLRLIVEAADFEPAPRS